MGIRYVLITQDCSLHLITSSLEMVSMLLTMSWHCKDLLKVKVVSKWSIYLITLGCPSFLFHLIIWGYWPRVIKLIVLTLSKTYHASKYIYGV